MMLLLKNIYDKLKLTKDKLQKSASVTCFLFFIFFSSLSTNVSERSSDKKQTQKKHAVAIVVFCFSVLLLIAPTLMKESEIGAKTKTYEARGTKIDQ